MYGAVGTESRCVPRGAEGPPQFLRQLRAEAQPLAAHRVVEGEAVGVEELALEAVLPLAAVRGVAGERMADRGEVGADLVGAAGLQPGLQVGLGAQQLDHLEMGACLARGGAGDGHAVALARGAPDRGVDRAGSRGEPPPRQGQVDPLDLRGAGPAPAAPRGPRRCGRRRAGRWCPCRAGGRSPAAPLRRRHRAAPPAR